MNIVFVNRFCYPDHSATSQIVSDLAVNLASKDYSVKMVASRMIYDDPSAKLAANAQWQGIGIHRIWTSRFGRKYLLGRLFDYLSFYITLPFTLLRVLQRGDIVVAKTDPPLVSLVVEIIARIRGAIVVNWLQDVFPELAISMGEPKVPRMLAQTLQKLRNISLKGAAMNVVIGSRMAEYFQAQGIAANLISTIPNWAHEDDIRPMPSSESQLRHALGFSDKFIVSYSGNLGRAHDPDTIFDAASALRESGSIVFLIIGGGHAYQKLRHQASESGLCNMHFLPYQSLETLSDSMAAADLHLVSLRPSLEGLIVPSKFYGIAASSRPIAFIGDPDGELGRIIRETGCGFVVEQGKGGLLADKILSMASDRQACLQQGNAARQMLDTKFSRARAHQQWHDLLIALSNNKA